MEFDGGVLGIGAGAQIISLIFGRRLEERKLIGVYEVEVLGGEGGHLWWFAC